MKTTARILVFSAILLGCLAAHGEDALILDGYDYDTTVQRMKHKSLSDVEGLWQFLPDGAVVAIERSDNRDGYSAQKFNVVIVKSGDAEVEEGTLIGNIFSSATANHFTAELFSNVKGETASKKKKFVLTLTDKGHLAFVMEKGKFRLDFWRWLPYLFRLSVERNKGIPGGVDGCVRLFPFTPEAVTEPIML